MLGRGRGDNLRLSRLELIISEFVTLIPDYVTASIRSIADFLYTSCAETAVGRDGIQVFAGQRKFNYHRLPHFERSAAGSQE